MKLRADLAAMIIAGLTVVAITLLALYSRTIPEVLPTIALVVVGGGVGIAAPSLAAAAATAVPAADSGAVELIAGKLEELLAHAETSTGAAQAAARAAVRAAQSVTDPAPVVPAPSTGYAPASATSNGYATTTGATS